ncbi:hypothetical protein JX266_000851 [Neoarthrinium moseri]|uniref:uncharacterized protein n=1 Tax=Neoarthrinium moseri TaxID=1658444 RepID=UPI001FDC2946|nr:uncharacterized protein JN550_000184 [Neoarthrinium moseri]KAI1854733.1 hypothetical protein JX266_000851 [Neoarthrinium moseri]KAI1878002.1 hypothetical protein JN550_000184 [Neoarthrinium moseri]
MLRPQLGRRALPRIASRAARNPRCRFSTQHGYEHELPPVRIVRPVLWSLAAVSTIYIACAAYEVKGDAKSFSTQHGWGTRRTLDSYDQLPKADHRGHRGRTLSQVSYGSPADVLSLWKGLPEAEKMIVGNIALNSSIWLSQRLTSTHFSFFHHVPVVGRNYTMLTSVFGHASGLHLFFNMACLYNFGGDVAYSRTFEGSGSHLAAFYLSSGVVTSLAQHLETVFPRRRFGASLGASGAIMAFIGVFGMSNPDSRIGIILLPGSLPAQEALGWIAAFEAYGMVFGIPFLRWAHTAHLAGLAVGAAYVHFDGKNHLWKPARKFAFSLLQKLNLI